MRKIFLLALLFLGSCGAKEMVITVTNPTDFDRTKEAVAIALSDIKTVLGNIEADYLVVSHGDELLAVQIAGGELLFQPSIKALGSEQYTIKEGEHGLYLREAYGRLVPERMDDWAWENNRIAFRVYGPALEATGELSNGIDVWVKSTQDLIIDKWYKSADYHTDHGEGLDYYKVGRTLGAGAMSPIDADTLCLSNNFVSVERVDDGAIRTTVRLTYAPYIVGGVEVNEQRVISLDANSNFNSITQIYSGDFDSLNVVAGITLNIGGEAKIFNRGAALALPADATNGTTYVAVVMDRETVVDTVQNHLAAHAIVRNGEPYTYYNGAGWSRGGFVDAASWQAAVAQQIERAENPLVVKF